LDGTLKNTERMAERQDLELKCGTAPKGGEKCGQKGGQEVPEGESKEKGQLSVYQSDQILREPQLLFPFFEERQGGSDFAVSFGVS